MFFKVRAWLVTANHVFFNLMATQTVKIKKIEEYHQYVSSDIPKWKILIAKLFRIPLPKEYKLAVFVEFTKKLDFTPVYATVSGVGECEIFSKGFDVYRLKTKDNFQCDAISINWLGLTTIVFDKESWNEQSWRQAEIAKENK